MVRRQNRECQDRVSCQIRTPLRRIGPGHPDRAVGLLPPQPKDALRRGSNSSMAPSEQGSDGRAIRMDCAYWVIGGAVASGIPSPAICCVACQKRRESS